MNKPDRERVLGEDDAQKIMETFTTIFNTDRPRLHSVCSSYIPEFEVEDVLWKVLLEALTFIRNRGRALSEKEVTTLAERRAIDRRRQLEREARLFVTLSTRDLIADQEARDTDERETVIVARQIAQEVIRRLTKMDAIIFSLCTLLEKTAPEAGREVELSGAAVRKRLSRTIKPTLKAVALEYGYVLTEKGGNEPD